MGVANVAGHWYVAGYDRDRRARRVFRLSRIVGDVQIHTSAPPVQVPKDVDVRSLINARPPEPEQVAVLEARTDAAHALRRAARRIVAGSAPAAPDGTWWSTRTSTKPTWLRGSPNTASTWWYANRNRPGKPWSPTCAPS